MCDLVNNIGRVTADLTAAGIRDNTVGAEIIASLHNGHKPFKRVSCLDAWQKRRDHEFR